MVRVRYYVVKAGSFWKITFNGRDYHFDQRARAIKVAIDAAHKIGGNAQVLVRGRNGNWLVEWSHGQNHKPPLNPLTEISTELPSGTLHRHPTDPTDGNHA